MQSTPPVSLLSHAVRNDDAARVEALLRQGADPFERNARGITLLTAAIIAGERAAQSRPTSTSGRLFATAQAKIAALFIAHAATLPPDRFPLIEAVATHNLAALRINLVRDPPIDANADEYGFALALTVWRNDAAIIPMLLAAGLDPDARVPAAFDGAWAGATMLTFAAARGSLPALKLLVERGADRNARRPAGPARPEGETPLMAAALAGHLPAVRFLLEAGAEVAAGDAAHRTALDHARRAGHKRIITTLEAAFERRDAGQALDLCAAAAAGIAYRVRALLDARADPDQRNEEGRTPLMLAAAAGHAEIVQLLCAAGAEVHATAGPDGQADLWSFALLAPNLDIVGCLIRHGLDPNAPRANAVPPLLMALLRADKPVLRLLLEHGADVHAPVPPAFVERARARRSLARRGRTPSAPPPEVGKTCSILDYARYFSTTELFSILAPPPAPGEPAPPRPLHDQLRAMLKSCAALADAAFQAEAARVGKILRAKPHPWKRRRGVVHYVSPLASALAAHYAEPAPPGADPRAFTTALLQRLQHEVAAVGYTLIYTGGPLAPAGLVRLLLFPLDDPLAAVPACGTNAANYGIGPRELVEWCEAARADFSLGVIGAGFDFLELSFPPPIADPEALSRRLAELCPDLQLRPDDTRRVTAFARELEQAGRVFLWWD